MRNYDHIINPNYGLLIFAFLMSIFTWMEIKYPDLTCKIPSNLTQYRGLEEKIDIEIASIIKFIFVIVALIVLPEKMFKVIAIVMFLEFIEEYFELDQKKKRHVRNSYMAIFMSKVLM